MEVGTEVVGTELQKKQYAHLYLKDPIENNAPVDYAGINSGF
jgi:hypothetical protein